MLPASSWQRGLQLFAAAAPKDNQALTGSERASRQISPELLELVIFGPINEGLSRDWPLDIVEVRVDKSAREATGNLGLLECNVL